jgi:hypothetical protein
MFNMSIAPDSLVLLAAEYLAARPELGRVVGWTEAVDSPDTHVWYSDGHRVEIVSFSWHAIATRGGAL